MQKRHDKKFDALVRRKIKEEGLENTPKGFTDAIMAKLAGDTVPPASLTHTPLIPRVVWYSLGLALIVLLTFFAKGDYDAEPGGLPFLSWVGSWLQWKPFVKIPDVRIPESMVYAFVVLAFFVNLQVYMITYFFTNRYDKP